MNKVDGKVISFQDLLQMRDRIPGSVIHWEFGKFFYGGPIKRIIVDRHTESLSIDLDWLKRWDGKKLELCEPKGFRIPFMGQDIVLREVLGNVVINHHNKYSHEVDYKIYVDRRVRKIHLHITIEVEGMDTIDIYLTLHISM